METVKKRGLLQKIDNLSLRKSFCFITVILLLGVIGLTLVTDEIIYSIQCGMVERLKVIIPNYDVVSPMFRSQKLLSMYNQFMSEQQLTLFKVTMILEIILPCIYVICGMILSAFIFYQWKIKKPLKIIISGTKKIQNQDLNFEIQFQRQDEMGELCQAFEIMRQGLYDNNIKMWNLLENRKIVNASIAHDLRSPITVIKGYSELLLRNIPKKKMNEEQLLHTANQLLNTADRMETYVESVRLLQRLDDIEVHYEKINTMEFLEGLTDDFTILTERYSKKLTVNYMNIPEEIAIDKKILMRILENILYNSCCHARKEIFLSCDYINARLQFAIIDDGEGFTNEFLKHTIQTEQKHKHADEHTGIGLSICQSLCDKINGNIYFENTENAGAKVILVFNLI